MQRNEPTKWYLLLLILCRPELILKNRHAPAHIYFHRTTIFMSENLFLTPVHAHFGFTFRMFCSLVLYKLATSTLLPSSPLPIIGYFVVLDMVPGVQEKWRQWQIIACVEWEWHSMHKLEVSLTHF